MWFALQGSPAAAGADTRDRIGSQVHLHQALQNHAWKLEPTMQQKVDAHSGGCEGTGSRAAGFQGRRGAGSAAPSLGELATTS